MTEEKDKTVYRRQADAQTPSKRRNKKKLRKLPFIILIILILLIAIIYIVHGYRSGVNYAKTKDIKVHKFNGPVKMTVRFLYLC